MRAPRTLAQVYQQFGPALRVLGTMQPSRRHPAVVLAALDDLALSGRAAELAAAYAAGDGDAAAAAAVGALVGAGADHPAQRNRLDAELALAATAPPLLRRGDPIDALPVALAAVPAGVLPVVMTTWALSRFPVKRRLRFLDHLEQAGADRPVAWVSAEGVGVAPGIPTFGDRPASGHSILGVAVIDRSGLRAEAVGRCWSRGAILAWLAEEQQPGLSPSAAR